MASWRARLQAAHKLRKTRTRTRGSRGIGFLVPLFRHRPTHKRETMVALADDVQHSSGPGLSQVGTHSAITDRSTALSGVRRLVLWQLRPCPICPSRPIALVGASNGTWHKASLNLARACYRGAFGGAAPAKRAVPLTAPQSSSPPRALRAPRTPAPFRRTPNSRGSTVAQEIRDAGGEAMAVRALIRGTLRMYRPC